MRYLLSQQQLQEKIAALQEVDALEISSGQMDEKGRLYIPYMMNDAIEDYLVLTKPEIRMDGNGKVRTVEAAGCTEYRTCYQYHLIGHFWRKGQEEWRRLVNTIGTLYDKQSFIGEEVCSDKERELIPLMGFAPFRFFSPVNDWDLDEIYPDSKEGLDRAAELAVEAGDSSFLKMILQYYNDPSAFMTRRLADELASGRHEALYHLLDEKITQASIQYEMRSYGRVKNRRISAMRRQICEMLKEKGFDGIYPHFHNADRTRLITAYEEHPFTVLEDEGFSFGIQLMERIQDERGIRRRVMKIDEW